MKLLRLEMFFSLTLVLVFHGGQVMAQDMSDAPPAPARVILEPLQGVDLSGAEVRWLVSDLSYGQEGEPTLVPAERALQTGGAVAWDLSLGSGAWLITAQLDGYWIQPRVVTTPSRDVLSLKVWPAAEISGVVRLSPGEPLPASITLRLAETSRVLTSVSGDGSRFDLSCPLDRQGRWSCTGPAGTFDLRLSSRTHIPQYRWGQRLPEGDSVDLGAIPLKRGASLVGWVTTSESEEQVFESLELVLSPLRVSRPDAESFEGSSKALKQVVGAPNKLGFFQFAGLEPGRYSLVARGENLGEVTVPMIDIEADVEASLARPVQLQPPAAVTLFFDPPFAPSGEPWRVNLLRAKDRQSVAKGEVDFGGVWDRGGLAADHYLVAVESGEGRFKSRWQVTDVVLKPDQQSFEIRIPVFPIRGLVTYDGEPVASKLWFGGQGKRSSLRFDTDEDGEFRGYLPRDGEWIVDAELEGSSFILGLDPVKVKRAPAGAPAEVELEIPVTRLTGTVVDSRGEWVEDAVVRVMDFSEARRALEGSVEDDGSFDLRGLPPGTVQLQAATAEGESEWVETEIEEQVDSGPIQLKIRSMTTVRGRVADASGPVSGVLVRVLPVSNSLSEMKNVVSGGDGYFELSVPSDTTHLDLWVLPASHALKVGRVAMPEEDRPLELNLARHAGGLRIEGGGRGFHEVVLYRDGIRIPMSMLAEWTYTLGMPTSPLEMAPLELPKVEQGRYLLCPQTLSIEGLSFIQAGGVPRDCVAGQAYPGANLDLSLSPSDLENQV